MSIHKSVLLKEVIENLNLKKGFSVIDATLGSGGHSKEILKKIGKDGVLIAFDFDKRNIDKFEERKGVFLINENFSVLKDVLEKLKIEKVDVILADLGYSSDQLENKEYGMSFLLEAPLDMRLDRKLKTSAKDIVNNFSKEDLEEIISELGEEKFSKKIVEKIVEKRAEKEIETTGELSGIIKGAVPQRYRNTRKHPATKTFQALRIAVNQELSNLSKFIDGAIASLGTGGRLAIISFHSLEDRIVKNKFRENARGCICPSEFPKCLCGKEALVKIVNKKPIVASEEEKEKNPRSRSAKLRIVEKI